MSPQRTKKARALVQESAPAARGRGRKYVYSFGDGRAEGSGAMKELLGGKGAGLAEMSRLGLPVPPGFTISTEVCTHFYGNGRTYPEGLREQVLQALARVERALGKRFGDPRRPLLVSVRSGARVSMPGMMDTVLNLGLSESTAAGLALASHSERFAWDAYRRFVQMYADVVLGLKAREREHMSPFAARLEELKRARGAALDTDLGADDLRALVQDFKRIVLERTGAAFPEDPLEQLWGAIGAVFGSWQNERAVAYRAMHHIPSDWGTAVSVVAMVFGNLGPTSGTGVCFTRDPSTGEKRFYGEVLMNAQGEDVVAGLRTPQPIETLRQTQPDCWKELLRIQGLLERHYRDMQDLEFTIEDGRLYMLQCRNGKRTGFAAARIAVDLVEEGVLSSEEALLRVDPEALDQLLKPVFEPAEIARAKKEGRRLTKGLNAGPGAASGRIVLHARDAEREGARESVILVRLETSPEDIKGMKAASGILTARGGMTSHAALVARQMGKVCVAGAGELELRYERGEVAVRGKVLREGDWISVDGSTGEVFEGRIATRPSEVMSALFPEPGGEPDRRAPARKPQARAQPHSRAQPQAENGAVVRAFSQLMRWADEHRTLGLRANADQPDQARVAVAFGAEGIGLCRTEHMFFDGEKIDAVREMILSEDGAGRARALAKLLPLQRRDFAGLFEEMAPRPVTIRTLDPPLHEFLPHESAAVEGLALKLGVPAERLRARVEALKELNPMLGHRGCRLGITFPEITAMQARAIFEAACEVRSRTGKTVKPEVMIPLVATEAELRLQARIVRDTAEAVFRERGTKIPYLVGTMIELPRAALVADEIAREAEFFSFGTNDLTQTTYGISRDDGARFIPLYVDREIFPSDPFASLDEKGVGELMRIACEKGRAARPALKLGICGEHGGDPRSVRFCHDLGLDYVSCSPHRLPIARLAAAQAALQERSRAGAGKAG